MPLSKLARQKEQEEKRQKRIDQGFPKAAPGDLVVYRKNPNEGYRMALVDSEDEGWVTSIRHLDGIVESFEHQSKRRILIKGLLAVEPTELLAKVEHLRCETWQELAEESREFRKDAKVSSEKIATAG
jgi:hypothetical protein